MIKDPGSGNKPGARDVCGARGGERAYILYKEYFSSFFTNAYPNDEAEVCLNMKFSTRRMFDQVSTKFNLVIPVLAGVGWSENCSFVLLIVQCRMETDQLKFLI